MITEFFINLGVYVLGFLTGLFPTSNGFPTEVMDSASYLGGIIGVFNPLVPLGTLATVLGLYVAFDVIVFGFKTFKWILSFVPFIGGKG